MALSVRPCTMPRIRSVPAGNYVTRLNGWRIGWCRFWLFTGKVRRVDVSGIGKSCSTKARLYYYHHGFLRPPVTFSILSDKTLEGQVAAALRAKS